MSKHTYLEGGTMSAAETEINKAVQDIAGEAAEFEPEAETVEVAVTETAPPIEDDDAPFLVRFHRPYKFEGKTYVELDLSGLEQLTSKDMEDADAYLARRGIVEGVREMSYAYTNAIAAAATGQPIEFFRSLPARDAVRVKGKITNFFFAEG